MSQKAQLNKPAPNFSLPDLNGKPFKLSDFNGKKNVVLIFNRGFI
jgi:peroxiredoxin